ncbi:MAG: hypothetical protein GW760_04605 [Legionella sp.]|nr:hypothetical protein [Legionella sp.]
MPNIPQLENYDGGLVLDFFESPEYERKDDTHTDALARDYVRVHMLPWDDKAADVYTHLWPSVKINT